MKPNVLILFMLEDHQQAPVSPPVSPGNAPNHQAPDLRPTHQQTPGTESNTAYCERVLLELIAIGTDIARMVHQDAELQSEYCRTVKSIGPTPPPTPEPTAAFDRIARAIRRTVTLLHKLPELARKANEPAKAAHKHPDRVAARKRIIRDVEDTIQRTKKDDEAEHLHAELHDRLDSPDLDDDIDHRPVDQIIADICRDLGIAHSAGTHPWKRRTPADILALAARAAMKAPAEARSSKASETPDSVITEPPPQRTARFTSTDPP
jgi:hypothetical protein